MTKLTQPCHQDHFRLQKNVRATNKCWEKLENGTIPPDMPPLVGLSSRLEESVFVYIELIAREKTTYLQANGQLSGDIVDLNKFSDDD